MLLTHPDLLELISSGAITASKRDVNATSIDVHLGDKFLVEARDPKWRSAVDINAGEAPIMREISQDAYTLPAGGFILAHTQERFSLPDDITGFFCLRSTLARAGLQHSTSVGLKPGWKGNLTLELSNSLKHHTLILRPGMVVGDVYFFRHESVNEQHLYRGKYQGISGVFGVIPEENREGICYNKRTGEAREKPHRHLPRPDSLVSRP